LTGSSNPLGVKENIDKIEFHIIFTSKDTIFFSVVICSILFLVINQPIFFIDPENMEEANPMKAPAHIQPE